MKELNEMELREVDGGFFLFLGILVPTLIQAVLVASLAAGIYASFKSGYNAVQ